MKNVLMAVFFGLLLVGCSGDDDGSGPTVGDCNQPTQFAEFNITQTSAAIEWEQEGAPSFVVEYGEQGFSLGSGEQITSTNLNAEITGLDLNTPYDYYIRAICETNNVSEFVGPERFTTLDCEKVTGVVVSDIDSDSAFVQFNSGLANTFEIEFGITGFTPGSGTTITGFAGSATQITGLSSDTSYDIYVRTVCDDTFSEYSDVVTFMTDSNCATPDNLFLLDANSTRIILEWSGNGETAFEVEYGLVGFPLGTGQTLGTSSTFAEIENLMPGTTYELYVRANCGSEGFSNYSEVLVATTNP